MKKFVSISMCFVILFSICVLAFEGENYALFSPDSSVTIPVNEHIGGDANGDGKVTLIDVVALLRASVGDMNNTSYHGLDVNSDGNMNVMDVLLVLSHVLGDEVGLGTLVK